MPEQKIYFQWQNEALEKTIYPLRTLNLRNTLEYYQEIDLWKQFKKEKKKIEDMPEEVTAYHKKKEAVVKQAKQDYDTQLSYFCTTKTQPEEAKLLDENMLGKIQTLHDAFNTYYAKYTDPFRQSYFITQRLETLDRERKDLDKRVTTQSRRVDIMTTMNKDNPKIADETEILEKLKRTQPVFEERRKQLVALISAFGKIESLKKEYIKQKDMALKRRKEIDTTLIPLQSKIALKETKLKEMQDDVRRLRRRIQPEPASVENYFAVPDAITDMAGHFPQTDPEFCKQVDGIREEIATLQDPAVKRARLKDHMFSLQLNRTRFEKRTDSPFKENTLNAYTEVLDQMKDFWSSLDNDGKPRDVLEKAIKDQEPKMTELQQDLTGLKKDAVELEDEVNKLKERILDVHEDNYLSQYRPIPPTLKDIIMLKLDEYRASLMKDGKDKDQYFLLDLLIKRFKAEPQRFPRWLQYMIVHFSGMRYASAHGSWANPKDLYLNLYVSLPMKTISDNLDKLDDFAIAELRQRKIAEYTGEPIPETDLDHELPKFAKAEDAESRKKIEAHLKLLNKGESDAWRQGLLNLSLDEECYEMTEQQALEALEDLREKGEIPDWMWKEISVVTQLRLTEAKDENWDKLTPDEQAQKNDAKWAKYRESVKEWKQKHLTGWREEHDRYNELIVSRAVCNEVAEHILHLRGHNGPAGLSSAQDWFINAAKKDEKLFKQNGAGKDVAYFVKPKKDDQAPYYRPRDTYRAGAAILWLKYRNDPPPLWNVVKPFETADGDALLPDEYLKSGRWTYKDNGLVRSGTFPNDKGMMIKRTQYLFWVHIATVAEVVPVEGEGTIVLTYETNLPYEDRRHACVGVFKRYLSDLLFDGREDAYNGAFLGYAPDNPAGIPTGDLDEMLNWDHVLLKTQNKRKGRKVHKEINDGP
jgi:hypothetical protein